jgi:hypothetical protein
MPISEIRTRLGNDLQAINGVVGVFYDEPDVFPAPADMPAFVLSMREPMLTAQAHNNTHVDYTWHFDLTLLYKPEGLGNPAENLSGLENLIKLTIDKLFANASGGDTWIALNKDDGTLEFSGGILTRGNAPDATNRVWGFTCTLDITEFVETTFSAGS